MLKMTIRAARLLPLILLLAGPARADKRYESMLIDPIDKTVTMSGPLGILSTTKTYFERSSLAGGRTLVREFREGSLEGEYFLSEKDDLIGRSERLLVLDEEFGRIDVAIGVEYTAGRIRAGAKMFQRHVPAQIPSTGKAPKAGHPDGFALIRVMKAPPRFIVVAADYTLDGTLAAFTVGASSGEWGASENGPQPPEGFALGTYFPPHLDPKIAAKVGLPMTVDPIRFETTPFEALPKPDYPLDRDIAFVYREHGAVIDRLIGRGSRIDHARLWFPPTEVEHELLRSERSFPFSTGVR